MRRKKRPKDAVVTHEIWATIEYDWFSGFYTNRDIKRPHVSDLVKAFEKKHIPVPVIVDVEGKVVDGQHRVEAARVTNSPVYVLVLDDITEEDILALNSNNANWRLPEHVERFVKMGNEDYATLKTLYDKHRIPLGVLAEMLMKKVDGGGLHKAVKLGLFRVTNYVEAVLWISYIEDFRDFFADYKNERFVKALVRAFRHPNYDHDRMLKKLAATQGRQAYMLIAFSKVKDSLRRLEEVYNWGTTEATYKRLF